MFKSCLFQILLVTLLFKYWYSPMPNIAVPSLCIHPTWPATSCHSASLPLVLCFLWANTKDRWAHFVWEYCSSNKWERDLWNSSKSLPQVFRGALVTWVVRENMDQSFYTQLGSLSKLHIQMDQRTDLKNSSSSVWSKSHSILHWQQDTISQIICFKEGFSSPNSHHDLSISLCYKMELCLLRGQKGGSQVSTCSWNGEDEI